MSKLTPLKSIRKHCLMCVSNSSQEVRLCPAKDCPFWKLRLGRSVKGIRPLKQIRAMCRQCVETHNDIRECDGWLLFGEYCPVHPYRFGVRPKEGQDLSKNGNDKRIEAANLDTTA
jgi:hypothetical protein